MTSTNPKYLEIVARSKERYDEKHKKNPQLKLGVFSNA